MCFLNEPLCFHLLADSRDDQSLTYIHLCRRQGLQQELSLIGMPAAAAAAAGSLHCVRRLTVTPCCCWMSWALALIQWKGLHLGKLC
jgi:hypothetical protein